MVPQNQYGFVYIWRDKASNKFYIGSHTGSQNDDYVCSSKYMLEEFQKRPADFHRTILESGFYSRKRLLRIEEEWLSLIPIEELGKKFYNRYNKTFHWTDAEITKEKISNAHKGKRLSEEHKKAVSIARINSKGKHKHSEETKRKISDAHKGKPCPWLVGRAVTKETRNKLHESLCGRKLSEKHKEKLSAAKRSTKNYNFGKHLSGTTKQKIANAQMGERNHMFGKHLTEEQKRKHSIAAKEDWTRRKQAKLMGEMYHGS